MTPIPGEPRSGSRTTAARVAAALACALALASACGPGGASEPGRPGPDVLVLVLDTVRADHLSLYGYERSTTPHLEEFAREALVFDDHWGTASWTLPAHATLFTGRYPSEIGLSDGAGLALPPGAPTLAEILRRGGWRTGCFTANSWISDLYGTARGFSKMEEMWREKGNSARDNHARALTWMRERRRAGEAFFAFVNDMEAHAPWDPPPEQRARFVRPGQSRTILDRLATYSVLDVPDGGVLLEPRHKGVKEAARDLYDGEIGSLDQAFGAFMDDLRTEGLLEDMLVVVLSDHGEGLGDHNWMEHGFSLHREILRVPLVIRLPDASRTGRVKDVVRTEDVLPTILEVCDVPPPPDLRGQSVLGATGGRIASARMRIPPSVMPRTELVLGAERAHLARCLKRSAYDGRWHLLEDDLGNVELYDVRTDPAEKHECSDEHPAEVERLRGYLR